MGVHADAAAVLLSFARAAREVKAWDKAQAFASAAQAEATLEMAEQQRAANIIDYMRDATADPEAMTPAAVRWAAAGLEDARDLIGLGVVEQ